MDIAKAVFVNLIAHKDAWVLYLPIILIMLAHSDYFHSTLLVLYSRIFVQVTGALPLERGLTCRKV
jgi:hypothetical protein